MSSYGKLSIGLVRQWMVVRGRGTVTRRQESQGAGDVQFGLVTHSIGIVPFSRLWSCIGEAMEGIVMVCNGTDRFDNDW